MLVSLIYFLEYSELISSFYINFIYLFIYLFVVAIKAYLSWWNNENGNILLLNGVILLFGRSFQTWNLFSKKFWILLVTSDLLLYIWFSLPFWHSAIWNFTHPPVNEDIKTSKRNTAPTLLTQSENAHYWTGIVISKKNIIPFRQTKLCYLLLTLLDSKGPVITIFWWW